MFLSVNCKSSPNKEKNEGHHLEESIVGLVEETKLYKDMAKLIDSLSSGKQGVSLLVNLQDTAKNVYLVRVAEDIGVRYVTYYNFLVDANHMKILNPTGKLNEEN